MSLDIDKMKDLVKLMHLLSTLGYQIICTFFFVKLQTTNSFSPLYLLIFSLIPLQFDGKVIFLVITDLVHHQKYLKFAGQAGKKIVIITDESMK